MADIAVIIPVFAVNETGVQWLREALESVISQDFDYEVVIVDDASPAVEELNALRFSLINMRNIKWFANETNRGVGFTRNRAIHWAEADWILPLDYDDRLLPGSLQSFYEARCEKGLVYGDLIYFGERTGYQQLDEFRIDSLVNLTGPMPVTSLFHRDAWLAAGGYAEALEGLEDIEFAIRLAAQGVCGKRIPVTTLQYRRHSDSRQGQLEVGNKERLTRAQEYIREKHRVLWGKLSMASCESCPGGTGPGQAFAVTISEGVGSDRVNVKYIGGKLGSFMVFAPETHIRYLIPGKGEWFAADRRDVPYFMGFRWNDGPEYLLEEIRPAPMSISGIPMPQLETADITTLSVEKASALIETATDTLDLRVWLAEENAGARRSTVIKAVQKRIKDLELQPA